MFWVVFSAFVVVLTIIGNLVFGVFCGLIFGFWVMFWCLVFGCGAGLLCLFYLVF